MPSLRIEEGSLNGLFFFYRENYMSYYRKVKEDDYMAVYNDKEYLKKRVNDMWGIGCSIGEIARALEISTIEVSEIINGEPMERESKNS